jgi:AcrR family transcriptional regulator
MPRIAEARAAAAPSSLGQKARHRRILCAAFQLAEVNDLDQVQMQDVAKEAQVAIATLYRYFPSKTHLFVALLLRQIDRFAEMVPEPTPDLTPTQAVADLLIRAQRELLDRPGFASVLIDSVNAANAEIVTDAAMVDEAFSALILRSARLADPSESDQRVVRLLVLCWFGGLTMTLNGRTFVDDAEADLRRACDLLLVDLGRVER